jgi:hypothetical protein
MEVIRLCHTNLIRLWRDDRGLIHFDRRYVSQDKVSQYAIEHTFEAGETSAEIAKMIHWGCCGWSAGRHQIWSLFEKVESFLN